MMTTTNLLNVLLTIHITGLTVAGGLSLSNYFAVKKFWKVWTDGTRGTATLVAEMPQPSRFFWIGLAMLIVSGALMMHLAYQAFMLQLWFQIKLGLILLIIVNAIIIHRQVTRLRAIVINEKERSGSHGAITSFKGKINALSSLQLLFFLLIFVFAVFRFN